MRVSISSFHLPKRGNEPDEYEDAWSCTEPFDEQAPMLRLAVADGATETSFSAEWARILADAYVRGDLDASEFTERLVPLQARWHGQLAERPLPWYAEQKLLAGAFATLAGLSISPGATLSAGTWSALAIGDSCIFQARKGALLTSFPLGRAEQFDSRPVLVSTNQSRNRAVADALHQTSGNWQEGDVFLLMTDALACAFLRQIEAQPDNPDPILMFCEQPVLPDLAKVIEEDRSELLEGGAPLIKNDDITLVRCQMLAN
jgi:hypothetical protein